MWYLPFDLANENAKTGGGGGEIGGGTPLTRATQTFQRLETRETRHEWCNTMDLFDDFMQNCDSCAFH